MCEGWKSGERIPGESRDVVYNVSRGSVLIGRSTSLFHLERNSCQGEIWDRRKRTQTCLRRLTELLCHLYCTWTNSLRKQRYWIPKLLVTICPHRTVGWYENRFHSYTYGTITRLFIVLKHNYYLLDATVSYCQIKMVLSIKGSLRNNF